MLNASPMDHREVIQASPMANRRADHEFLSPAVLVSTAVLVDGIMLVWPVYRKTSL
jgi:hypothetical protein